MTRLLSLLARMVAPAMATTLLALPAAHAAAGWTPDGAFAQYGRAGDHADSATLGLVWDWDRHWSVLDGDLRGFWDLGLARWQLDDDVPGHSSTVLIVTPTFRWSPQSAPWFVEAAIGASLMTPLYSHRDDHFGTSFNFADHLGVGLSFGERRRHELTLRYEHFSNGSIKQPNPGENFVELRYAYRWQ